MTDATESLTAIWTALNAGQLDAAIGLYDPDAAIFQSGSAPIEGIDAIRTMWASALEGANYEITPRPEREIDFGQLIVLEGRVTGEVTPKGGQAIEVDLWFMQLYRRGADGIPRFWRGASGTPGA